MSSPITLTPNGAQPQVSISTTGTGGAAPLAQFTRDQVALIKRTLCPQDTTDDELKLFLHVARESGLDPLRRQIHCTKRKGRLAIIAGIEGLMARASQQEDFQGLLGSTVCAKDEFLFDAAQGRVLKHTVNPFAERGALVGAWATVQRKGLAPFSVVVRLAEFTQQDSPTWRQMPHQMILKVAKSQALRAAYPERFGGVYEQAEVDGTASAFDAATVAPEVPHATVHGVFNKREYVPEQPPEPMEVFDVVDVDAERSDAHLTPEDEVLIRINEAQTSDQLRRCVEDIQRLKPGNLDNLRSAYSRRAAELKREGC